MNHSRMLLLVLMPMLFPPLLQADELSDCGAWLENRAPLGANRLPAVDAEQLTSAGVSIEPRRRMRAEGYDWDHEIQIALPPSYGGTNRRFPVLWVTDGQFFFNLAVGIVTSCAGKYVPEMIVVGIGSPPEASKEAQMRRTFDFSPNAIRGYSGFGSRVHNERDEAVEKRLKAQGKVSNERMGGAPRFLRFVVEDVRQRLAQDYRLADSHVLFGHSGGGLFCTYALLAQPENFDRYICGSGSLAAGDFEVFRMEERHAQEHEDLPVAVFFGVGEAEVLQGGTWGVFSTTARMAEILKMRAYPSLKLHFRSFEGEDHLSVIPLIVAWGLRAVWEGDFAARPAGSSNEVQADRPR